MLRSQWNGLFYRRQFLSLDREIELKIDLEIIVRRVKDIVEPFGFAGWESIVILSLPS